MRRIPAPRGQESGGCVTRGEEHVRIQDAGWVERFFDSAEGRQLRIAPVQMEPRSLRRSDAVLGADAAAQLSDISHDPVIDAQVIGCKPGHVDVDVAITEVAEQPSPRVRVSGSDNLRHLVDESGQRGRRQRDIELVGRTERVDRLGVTLSVVPELGPSGALGGDGGIFDGGDRTE